MKSQVFTHILKKFCSYNKEENEPKNRLTDKAMKMKCKFFVNVCCEFLEGVGLKILNHGGEAVCIYAYDI